jgi:hypothetical protein
LIIAGALSIWACSPVSNRTVFEFEHPADDRGRVTLVAITDKPAIIEKARAELAKSPNQRRLHINGPIARGDGGHNTGWRWHFVPNEWDLAEISIEVCDGQPSYVDQHLDAWLRDVGRYCPWSSRIVRER